MDYFTADFSHGSGFTNCAVSSDTNTFKIVSGYTDAGYYFQDENLNWYLSEEKFYDKNGQFWSLSWILQKI